jgi:alpha-tubulin suppressor-like RCC1 family protein
MRRALIACTLCTVVAGVVPPVASAAIAAAGYGHTVILKSDGTVWTWGYGGYGQLGNASWGSSSVPVQVSGLSGVQAIASGAQHVIALKTDGTVWAWGDNYYGELGDGTNTSRNAPVQVSGLLNVTAIGAGDYHSIALKSDGTVSTWGYNYYGQLGDGGTTSRNTPGQLTGLSGVIGVAGGGNHTLVVLTSGAMKSWGVNSNGQLGDGTTSQAVNPVSVSVVSGAGSAAGGGAHSLALCTDGVVWAWGYNGYGALGDRTTTQRLTAVSVRASVAAVAAGSSHSLAIQSDGTVWAWGYNGYGALGDGTTTYRTAAVQASGLASIYAIAGGLYHSAAVGSDGSVWTWGFNYYGQLGDGTSVNRSTPVKIAEAGFSWKASNPTFSLAAGTYSTDQTVSISTATSGATIYYTTDGTTPTAASPVYSAPVSITATTTLQAKAVKAGFSDSQVTTAVYTMLVATPTMSPGTGTYTTPQTVTISSSSPNPTIRYTTDGTDPTPSSTQYTGPLAVGSSTTLKARGFKAGWTTSGTASATYTMNFGTLAAPTMDPATSTYVDSVAVTVTASAGATIRYTTDGTDPTSGSSVYTGPITLTSTTTLKAKAFETDYNPSSTTTNTYTVKAATPVLSLPGGTYAAGSVLTITSTTQGATLHYTLSGSDPTESDTPISSGGAVVVGNFTLKVRSFKAGCVSSDIASATYAVTGQMSGGSLAVGDGFALLLRPDGLVAAWGTNSYGQLGDGTATARRAPSFGSGLNGIVGIAAGRSHALAVTSSGTVWAWGYNGNGQLGDGTTNTRTSPVRVVGLSDVVAVAAGGSTSAALQSDGTLWMWGENYYGQLGTGDTTDRTTPVQVMTQVAEVSIGLRHCLARKTNGTTWAWGANESGQLGDGTATGRLTPVSASGLGGILHVDAGDAHSVALGTNGWVWTWGSNGYGQLGDGSTTSRTTPARVPGFLAVAIAAGSSHSLIARTDGTVWGSGRNDMGQLGDGTGVSSSSPVQAIGLVGVVAVAAGANSSFAITADEAVWAWGRNDQSQLGDGTTWDQLAPLNVALAGYRWRAAAPQLDHVSGTYYADFNLAMSTASGGAIRFTVDGSEPTLSSLAYMTPYAITRSVVLKAKTISGDGADSNTVVVSYEMKVAAPQFAPDSGNYPSPRTVVISTSTANAAIRYTVNLDLPLEGSALYTTAVTVSTATSLRARGFRDGWTPSDSRLAIYTFNLGTLAPPVITPAAGTYESSVQVTIAADPVATVRYTRDGSDPTASSPVYASPILVTSHTTIKARAFHPDWTTSAANTATYNIKLASPSLSLAPGQYSLGQALTVSSPDPGVTIGYTLDGTNPTATSTAVSSGETVNLMGNLTFKAAAFKVNCVTSDVVSAAYTVVGTAPTSLLGGGEGHSLALTTDGLLWAWGSNGSGQLGDGTTADRLAPVPGPSLSSLSAMASGYSHNLALTSDGSVWAWGFNYYGQLGDGTSANRSLPYAVTGVGTGALGVAAGDYHSLAIKADRTVLAWGLNSNGQLGDGTTTSRATPAAVSGLASVLQVASRGTHSLALKTDGTVVAWGNNASGQLGDGSRTQRTTAVAVSTLSGVTAIAAGAAHSLALTTGGSVWAWGYNYYGQLGDGSRTDRLTPVRVSGLTGVVAIAAAGNHSFALRSDGTIWAWGYNGYGQLGLGGTTDSLAPALVPAVRSAVAVGAGTNHGLAASLDGVVWSWGGNGGGQLGDGSRQQRPTPAPLSLAGGTWTIATPTFGTAPGAYSAEQDVVVACATSGVTIRYTVGGSDPTPTDAVISSGSAVHVASSLTLKARAFKEGQNPSQVAVGVYTLALSAPVLSPSGGTYGVEQSVTISAPTGATVRFTTDGTDPTEASPAYASPISVTQSSTLKAKAWRTGWNESGMAAQMYTLKVLAPVLSPAGGSFSSATQVSVSTATSGATVHYTLDGSDPTLDDPTTPGGVVLVDHSTTLRTKAWRTGWAASDTSEASFGLSLGTTASPTFDPPAGTYDAVQSISLASSTPGAIIRFTTDGREPTWDSAAYNRPVPIEETTTLKARAFGADRDPSAVVSAVYTLTLTRALMPQLDPPPGRYTVRRIVTVTCPTAGSTVRYTFGGADPTETDVQVACGGTITVDRSAMLKLRAWKTGLDPSAVRQADYEVTGMVSAGGFHSLALDASGRVWAWGYNGYGQLGDATTTDRLTPVQLPAFGASLVVAVAAGRLHSLALTEDGRVWAWGYNYNGQLGDGTTTNRTAPVELPAFSTNSAVALSAGQGHSLALTSDGRVWAWGYNAYGQLGDGTWTDRATPVQLPAFSTNTVTAVSAGAIHSLALTADGRVWAWGYNGNGQLGDGTSTSRNTPVQAMVVGRVVQIAAGDHSLVRSSDDAFWAWGYNASGQLGDGTTSSRVIPIRAPFPPGGVTVAAGNASSLATALEGGVAVTLAWGANGNGQLGDGSTTPRLLPAAVSGLENAFSLAEGEQHSLAIGLDGSVWSWGHNGYGQLGNGGRTDASIPAQVPGLTLVDNTWLTVDPDGDGLPTGVEHLLGTDPLSRDTNGDGIDDGAAAKLGISPVDPDSDHDGLTNPQETVLGTDPFNPDTDGDGALDGADCLPLDATRWACPPVPGDATPPVITLVEPANARVLP